MKYCLGKGDWATAAQGESHCFLLVNGLGGYCSQTVIGSNARHDHGLLIAADPAPSERYAMVRQLEEILHVDDKSYVLSSQSFVTKTQNQQGYRYLNRFELDAIPTWEYMAAGVVVRKRISMVYGKNRLAAQYEIDSTPGQKVWLEVIPVYGFHSKNDRPTEQIPIICHSVSSDNGCFSMEANGQRLFVCHSGQLQPMEQEPIRWYYYEQDSVDGRDAWGGGFRIHRFITEESCAGNRVSLTLLYSMDSFWAELLKKDASEGEMQEETAKGSIAQTENGIAALAEKVFREEKSRQQKIQKQCGLTTEAGKQLAVSAQAYLTQRESTNGMSIMAGFPFFGDWGRDTMIAFYGCTAAIGEQAAAKSILKTFMQYCRRGIMPNLFPEGGAEPLYNTVDASLLFINALWEYVQGYHDLKFAAEAIAVVEAIICWYAKGTDYNIHMESDCLLAAGSGLWQLTWMDVRFGEILPTPRHGKPVEINAYWYNAVMIFKELLMKLQKEGMLQAGKGNLVPSSADEVPELTDGWRTFSVEQKCEYLKGLSAGICDSFRKKFTKENGSLYDVLPEQDEMPYPTASGQVRCNMVFALTMPFGMIEKKQAQVILAEVRRELYTSVGLRSLSIRDPEFHPVYGGEQFARDMAYHQGTVWVYPLGAYYRACLRYAENPKQQAKEISEQLKAIESAMAEGCLGHLPEIYDGEIPGESKGCFAQAWSVAELLRVYEELEKAEK